MRRVPRGGVLFLVAAALVVGAPADAARGGGGVGRGPSRPPGPRPNPRPHKPQKPMIHFYRPYHYYDPFYFGSPYFDGRNYRDGADAPDGARNVEIKVSPKKAEILVGGVPYGTGRAKVGLPSGTWKVELRAEGYEPQSFDVLVEPGGKYKFERKLQKLPAVKDQ
jgi:hypothetical protein